MTHLGNPATASAVFRWRAALKESVHRSAVDGLLDLLASHHDDDPAFAHGGLSIGGIVPVTTGAYDSVLTGEDSGGASAGHDIGWLVGELIELRATAYDAADEHLMRRAQLLEKVWSDDAWASTGCPPAF